MKIYTLEQLKKIVKAMEVFKKKKIKCLYHCDKGILVKSLNK